MLQNLFDIFVILCPSTKRKMILLYLAARRRSVYASEIEADLHMHMVDSYLYDMLKENLVMVVKEDSNWRLRTWTLHPRITVEREATAAAGLSS